MLAHLTPAPERRDPRTAIYEEKSLREKGKEGKEHNVIKE